MDAAALKGLQAPFKQRYRDEPAAAVAERSAAYNSWWSRSAACATVARARPSSPLNGLSSASSAASSVTIADRIRHRP